MGLSMDEIFRTIASERGIKSSEDVYREIQKSIDIAWQSKNKSELEYQNRFFSNGKPTVEEFINVIANQLIYD